MKLHRTNLLDNALLVIHLDSELFPEATTFTITEQIPPYSSIKDINEFVCSLLDITGEQLLNSSIELIVYNP